MRSFLFVPGDSAHKLERGLTSGADVLVIDLEDSIAASAKPAARQLTSGFIESARAADARPQLLVRINTITDMMEADLRCVAGSLPDGIMLPKTVGGADVQVLSARLAAIEAEAGVTAGTTRIVAIAAESARGIFGLGTLADADPRLGAVTWGSEDLAADLGAESNRDAAGDYTDPYRLARALTLMAASAAGVDAIDTVYTNFRDPDGLAKECRTARRDGFTGKLAIHPDQVAVINDAFTPDAASVERARRIVALFAAQPGSGVVSLDGKMIDVAHFRQARRTLARIR